MDRDAWCAAVHGVTKNRTQLSYWTELNCTWVGSHAAGPLGPHVLPRVHVLMDSQALAPASFVGTFSGSGVHLPAQHMPSRSEWWGRLLPQGEWGMVGGSSQWGQRTPEMGHCRAPPAWPPLWAWRGLCLLTWDPSSVREAQRGVLRRQAQSPFPHRFCRQPPGLQGGGRARPPTEATRSSPGLVPLQMLTFVTAEVLHLWVDMGSQERTHETSHVTIRKRDLNEKRFSPINQLAHDCGWASLK